MTAEEGDLRLLGESIVAVLADECDSIALHKFYDGAVALDAHLWSRAGELGWAAIALPEEAGGLGMGSKGLVTLFVALGQFVAPGAFLATLPAAQWLAEADPAVAAQWLPAIIAAETELAVAAAPEAGTLRLAEGKLEGEVTALLGSAAAAIAVVPADGAVALVALDAPGVAAEVLEMWDRTRPMLRLACRGVAPLALVADPDGTKAAALFRLLALAIAADCIGGARRIALQTVEYLKTREQFGRPLASFQALKHRAANLVFPVEAAAQNVLLAADLVAQGDPHAAMWSALAKAAASAAYKAVAEDCLQLHGGVGYTWEYDPHIFLKRALLNQSLGGANHRHRDLAAAHLRAATVAGLSTAELAA